MGFMGKVFKVLGFESENAPRSSKSSKTKGTYKLREQENSRPSQIDGVSVYYPEKELQCEEFVKFVREGRAIIISIEFCQKEEGRDSLLYLKGFCHGSNARMITLNEDKLYLILPEGMEVEE